VVACRALDAAERPRERLLAAGPAVLSDREVVALLLGSGTRRDGVLDVAARVLEASGGTAGLGRIDARRLLSVEGIGPDRASRLVAAVELGRRCLARPGGARPVIRGPEDLRAPLLSALGGFAREVLGVFLLDARMRALEFRIVGSGSLTAVAASARDVFAPVLCSAAAAVILAHNHPSGDPTPSPEDIDVTARLVEAGRALEIPVLDHLILGGERIVSLKSAGRMP
jgi:DNA repair protein RadC